ncbi:MAG: nucleotidyltransferase domain-containing protein [Clostridia bacterium]|nr:nucleotidyltransferase domain-containing protein [Clostridia bacterium]
METLINRNTVSDILFPVFQKHGINKAVLFGSVAKGTNNINSDIDIVVDSHLKGLKFIGLLEDVKQAINMDVDLFDISHIEKGSLVEEEIKRTGVLIYEK